jgi:hypothetical protein
MSAEPSSSTARAVREVGAGEALGEAEVVLDRRALPGLAAGGVAFDDDGREPLGRGVHRRREPGRTATDDAEVVERLLRARAQAEGVGDLDGRGRAERGAVGEGDHGQVVGTGAGELEQSGRLLGLADLEPAVGHVVVGEEGLHLDGALGPPVAHDSHLGVAVGVAVRPVAQQLVEHRVEPLLGRVPRLHQVVVERDVVDRSDRDVGVGVRREQHELGVRRLLPHLLQHLDAGHPWHPLVADDRGDGPVLEQLVGQHLQGLRPRGGAQDAVVLAVALAQVAHHGSDDGDVVVDREDRGLGHGTLPVCCEGSDATRAGAAGDRWSRPPGAGWLRNCTRTVRVDAVVIAVAGRWTGATRIHQGSETEGTAP